MKLAPTIIILGSLLTAGSLQAKWSRIPIIKEKPVNTIGGPGSNATLDSSAGFGHADSILSSDIIASSTVSAGKSFVLVNLGKPVLISSSSFVNDGVEGRATLSASADKNGWAVLEEKVFSTADRTVEFKFAGMQAKFVKLELALSKGGMIRYLQLFGAATDSGYAVKQSADGKGGKPMDLINGLGGARVIYAAPKPANGLDTAITYNKFAFPESDEKYRTIIYDFGQLRILNEFASVHSPRPVRFEVFAFDNLPEKEDWRGRMAFDPNDFGSKSPVAVAEDTRGTGTLKAKPTKAVKTRYLALRWEPEFNPPDFQCTGGAEGNVSSIVTSNTVVITNANGTHTVVTVTVTNAHGAGAGTSPVTPSTPAQAIAQGAALSSDTSVVSSATFAAGVDPLSPGTATPLSSTTTTGSTTVTVTTVNGVSTTSTTSTQTDTTTGNVNNTTVTETKNTATGATTTTVNQTSTNPSTGTTTLTNATNTGAAGNNSVNTTNSTGTNSNLGSPPVNPSPVTTTPGTPAANGGGSVTPVSSP